MAARLKKEERAEVEREGWRLRVRGWTEARIAEHLGVDQSTVSRALRRIEERLHGEFLADAHLIKSRQTAQHEFILAEALEEWERSKLPAEVRKTVTKETAVTAKRQGPFDPDAGTEPEIIDVQLPAEEVTVTHEERGQTGNPALLAKAIDAAAAIRKIWGAEAPERIEGGDPERPILVKRLRGVTMEDLR